MSYILTFKEVDKGSLSLVGGKNASLGEMIKAGIRVPPGFAVTTESYLQFITETGIKDDILHTLSEMKKGDIEALNKASASIQAMIVDSTLSGDIRSTIEKAYEDLCKECGVTAMPVAVRSSATAEDLPTASFAGQQDTYLWIQGVDQVTEKIQLCWASLFTPRAIDYRVKNNFPHEKVLISVGVQKMVNARAAGVMFTLNPTNGDPTKVVIEGSWGLGETVVSGSVNPDKFVVDKVIMEISEKTVSSKHIECVYNSETGGVVDAQVDEARQCQCCLEDQEIKTLVRTAKVIEKHYQRPMDIEWSIDKDLVFPENIFIVQARPETVWSRRETTSKIGKKSGYQLLMEQAMKRIKIPKQTESGDDSMSDENLLSGKKLLVVDDEPDILDTLEDLLDMCEIVKASNFSEAQELLESQIFDIAVLDIMGVDGYKLLEITQKKNVPALMLTAHAFTPDNLIKSIKKGASSYIPKEEIVHIADYLISVLKADIEGRNPWQSWQEKLPSSYFEKRWGAAWKDTNKEFWETFRASLKSRK